ncbi:hypothetical protein A2U01_0112955, partial [Trifolium medium]|nr:hypothetical protein [Trifolium medium]
GPGVPRSFVSRVAHTGQRVLFLARCAASAARCAVQGKGFGPWRIAQPCGARCAEIIRPCSPVLTFG